MGFQRPKTTIVWKFKSLVYTKVKVVFTAYLQASY